MSEPILPSGPQFLEDFKDLKRRLEALERAARMPFTSQRGGTFELLDEQGRAVFYFGTYARPGDPPGYGVMGRIPDGAGPGTSPTVLEIDDDGLEAPFLEIPMHAPNLFTPITSAVFVDAWQGDASLTVARAVQVAGVVGVDAATTGQVRVVAGSRTSDVVTCPGGVFTTYVFNLLLTANTIGSGPLGIHLEARRTAGAGNVNVYIPRACQAGNDGINATVTGL